MRLEETSSVRAISARGDGKIVAAYADGTCKKWSIGHGRVSVQTLFETADKGAIALHLLEVGDVVIATAGSVTILGGGATTDDWQPHTAFNTREYLRLASLGPQAVTAHLESPTGTELIVAGLLRRVP